MDGAPPLGGREGGGQIPIFAHPPASSQPPPTIPLHRRLTDVGATADAYPRASPLPQTPTRIQIFAPPPIDSDTLSIILYSVPNNAMKRIRYALSIVASLALAACGTAESSSGTTDAGGGPDLGGPDIVTIEDAGGAGADSSEDEGPELATIGEPCSEDDACESFECLVLIPGEDGICSEPCSDQSNCPEDWDCVLLSDSGADAQQVCVPNNLCADPDMDGYGVGPGCLGEDCDEQTAAINDGAEEICDGIDNDCDDRVDENPIGVGEDCDTGFGGVCQLGRQVCTDAGVLECRARLEPTGEICDGSDNDCDGDTDEGEDGELLSIPCYDGPAETEGVGACTAGVQTCTLGAFGSCEGQVIPGIERCDGIDNDCNGLIDDDAINQTDFYADSDGDGFGDPLIRERGCTAPEGFVDNPADCDDRRDFTYPGAPELCDTRDNNCNGDVDEDAVALGVWYLDDDRDGFGDPDISVESCELPPGYVDNGDDCDDTRDFVYPGADEVCDGRDNDCDDEEDEEAVDAPIWYEDADSDTFGNAASSVMVCDRPDGYVPNPDDCDDTNDMVNPARDEVCNGADDNCDEVTDTDAVDRTMYYPDADVDTWGAEDGLVLSCSNPDPALYVERSGDCNDMDGFVSPDATEVCDLVDNDCDDVVDEDDAADAPTWYFDDDRDAYGDPTLTTRACSLPAGYVSNPDDCDDTRNERYPGNPEVCDGIDNDCNLVADDGVGSLWFRDRDGDGFGDLADSTRACSQPTGYLSNNTDCNDGRDDTYPGAPEICDRINNDCDTTIDETCPTGLSLGSSFNGTQYGGGGGTLRTDACPAGYVLIGLRGRDGSEIDALGAICGRYELTESGTPISYGIRTNTAEVDLTQRGGSGGSAFRYECPDGQLVRGIDGRAAARVDNIGFTCQDPNVSGGPGSFSIIYASGYAMPNQGGSGGSTFNYTCPGNSVAVGIVTRSGSRIDRVGLICADLNLSGG